MATRKPLVVVSGQVQELPAGDVPAGAEPSIAAPVSAPTEKYWRGDKSWRDFATDVRAATLTGLSTATNAVVAATDTVLTAIGKLQAQVSTKFDKTGGNISGAVNVSGNLLATGGALGYGIGAGGTVTQDSAGPWGKSTPVYLNKPSGTITMHNASLAAGAAVEFSLHNTLLATGDGLIVNPDGFTGYAVEVAYFNAAAEVVLRVTNKGATRSDAVAIRFRIFKGALA